MFEIDENNLPFVRTRQALILLDLQNDFIGERSLLPVETPPDFIGNIRNLAEHFRPSGDVIWIRSVFPDGKSRIVNQQRSDSEIIITNNELPRRQRHSIRSDFPPEIHSKPEDDIKTLASSIEDEISEAFLTVEDGESPCMVLPNSTGSEFAESLTAFVSSKDLVFHKTYYSAFKDGSLVQTLRGKFVTEIYICGVLTNVSVFATAMDAARHGYAITIVEDCLGYRSKARHDEALRQLKVYTGCDVINSVELIESCQKQKKAAERRTTSSKKSRPKPKESRPAESRSTGIENLMGSLKLEAEDPQATTTKQAVSEDDLEITSEMLMAQIRRAKPPAELEAEAKKRERVRSKVKTRRRPSSSGTREARAQPIDKTPSPTKETRSRSSETPSPVDRVETKTSELSRAMEELRLKYLTSNGDSKKEVEGKSPKRDGTLCEGDTTIIENLLPEELASQIFLKIRDEVLWQKMGHQGGEVPRLVAVQGKIEEDGSIPIYRHPADESPALLPFSPTVLTIKSHVEKKLGHSVNHVLIQFYRDGNDNISEHSDKTLDILPNTFVANVSLGAQRTMVFRTKKPMKSAESRKDDGIPRESCRAALPHNSLCRMGLETNKKWLHGIRPDKRLQSEKSEAELAYDSGRISLTFRCIGTYLDKTHQKIWGQGATAKDKHDARPVINGDTPESKEMLQAFSKENHDSNFDWKKSYGKGFDVLHISNSKKLFLSGDYISDFRIRFMLSEYNVPWIEGTLSPSFNWNDTPTDEPTSSTLPIKFIDNDATKTTVEGCLPIMLYLDAMYGSKKEKQASDLGREYTRLSQADTLLNIWRTVPFSVKPFRAELSKWESYAAEAEFIAGDRLGLADFAVLPILEMVSRDWADGGPIGKLVDYWERMLKRESVARLFGKVEWEDLEERFELVEIRKKCRAKDKEKEEREKAKEDGDVSSDGKGNEVDGLVDGVAKL